jgi:hypothetical protein
MLSMQLWHAPGRQCHQVVKVLLLHPLLPLLPMQAAAPLLRPTVWLRLHRRPRHPALHAEQCQGSYRGGAAGLRPVQ